MTRRLQTTISIGMVLLLFVSSLSPLIVLEHRSGDELRAAIVSIQRLYEAGATTENGFATLFGTTIAALKTAAGYDILQLKPTEDQSAAQPLVLSARLPFLLPASMIIADALSSTALPRASYLFILQTYSPLPETPPPLRSRP